MEPPHVGCHEIRRLAQMIAVEDRQFTFQIEARDDHEVIVRGLHKCAVIRTESFSRRVKEKLG
jgi:predicted thioesterase